MTWDDFKNAVDEKLHEVGATGSINIDFIDVVIDVEPDDLRVHMAPDAPLLRIES